MFRMMKILLAFFFMVLWSKEFSAIGQVPLPAHPRPDFIRQDWINLNGIWEFTFEQPEEQKDSLWCRGEAPFDRTIMVPFPWGSPLSGVEDKGDVAWYKRKVHIPQSWKGKRVFLVIGACDWQTEGWLSGKPLGEHEGGYTPFDFELTPYIEWGEDQQLVLKADDQPAAFKLFGKQGYGNARGIWQTVYLEARGDQFFEYIHFSPDIDNGKVKTIIRLDRPLESNSEVVIEITGAGEEKIIKKRKIQKSEREVSFNINIPGPRLWTLDDPFLYSAVVSLKEDTIVSDKVSSYFGMRKISVVSLPGQGIPYIALNNEPVYLQLTLDQAYHPEGYYTFPDDDFIRDDLIRTKKIGLNGQRVHVKVPLPRKLYWADKLGVLIMSDVPNSWGNPDADMRKETEHTIREMIKRDYNHPSVFAWVLFNETWGLQSKDEKGLPQYTEETRMWVSKMYGLAKSLDPTRLVEDNSANRKDHVRTDINSWHAYLPGYEWEAYLDKVCDNTFSGSTWNFAKGYRQESQPMINSECGNVWGYKGSTGDVDWSWDYHQMINAFRRHPKIAGWLYTEHHDVINEWNGYYRYDRSEKETGLGELMPGMTLRDLHSPVFVVPETELCMHSKPKSTIAIPLWISVMTDQYEGETVWLKSELTGWNTEGIYKTYVSGERKIKLKSWESGQLQPLIMRMPDEPGLMILRLTVMTDAGTVLHRNFTTFNTATYAGDRFRRINVNERTIAVLSFKPGDFKEANWNLKQWDVLDHLKENGSGKGYFLYEIKWPEQLLADSISSAVLRLELSSRPLLGKDQSDTVKVSGNYMKGKGLHDPGKNPNAYPMTDEIRNPSIVSIQINNETTKTVYLPDDPADHRGVLSWDMQLRDGKLQEAGTYGYLVNVPLDSTTLAQAHADGKFIVRLEVDDRLPGGLSIYGRQSGRYPFDPTLLFIMKK